VPETSTLTLGVSPQSAFAQRTRLWKALESVHQVRFCPRAPGEHSGLSGLIAVADRAPVRREDLPVLRIVAEEPREQMRAGVHFGESETVDQRLRGRLLHDTRCGSLAGLEPGDDLVLASVDGVPVWTAERRRWRQQAAMLPAELASDEILRDRLRDERFLALIPILELLRQVTADRRWQAPALRAAFILDDPNLHWPSYGFADFAALADAAERERFHVAIAAVPLDMWYSHPAAVRQFRRRDALSLLVHGNDHLHCELARELPERELLAVLAQAQRRVGRFERRTKLRVARVMAPPHGQCSRAMLRALSSAGFQAACISRPYPWLARAPAEAPWAQWELADVPDGCAPVISRHPFAGTTQDIYLRAYLDQPLVLYGHHGDLAEGLGPLSELAAAINSLGAVTWMSLGAIADGNFLTRDRGEERRVRLYTRQAELELPSTISQLVVDGAREPAERQSELLEVKPAGSPPLVTRLGERLSLPGGQRVRLRLIAVDAPDVESLQPPARSIWAPMRRALVEVRDRTAPRLASLPGR
jgi:hypothetical protein